jgi:hypothetical protein
VTLSSTVLLGFSGGRDADILPAILAALVFAVAIGLINGTLVAILKLNALIVTLAVGAITTGATLWYRESLPAESRVPEALADWGVHASRAQRRRGGGAAGGGIEFRAETTFGRRFAAVGANPRSAWVAGLDVWLADRRLRFRQSPLRHRRSCSPPSSAVQRFSWAARICCTVAAAVWGTAIWRRRRHGGGRGRRALSHAPRPAPEDARPRRRSARRPGRRDQSAWR